MWKTAILGFVIVLVGAVFALAQVGVNPARPAPTIMKWEYDTETLDSNGNGFLNNLGLQVWELVAVTPETIVIEGGVRDTKPGHAYFKRPKQN
jgi:hypothetical protein